jgi:sensor histidine kinase YesM
MNNYDLVLSDKSLDRITRHFIFWLTVFLYHVVRISFLYPSDRVLENAGSILSGALIWGTFFNMMISYTIVYYLIPKFYNKRKYFIFIAGLFLVFIVAVGLNILYIFSLKVNKQLSHAIFSSTPGILLFLKATTIRLLGNPPLICGTLLSLRAMKNWYLKQQENVVLVRENTSAELQLLKAQIHPHFLFNTLNNIYSFTITKSPDAAGLVEKLTDTLHYMITDCDVPMIPIEKELKMISDYMDLERVRYGNQLQMQTEIQGDFAGKLIAPLLLIPFVENSFKHGTSKILGEPWIRLKINVEGNTLFFELINNKPKQATLYQKRGIGLNNVQKRLGLIYPGKHILTIKQTTEIFEVKLSLPLQPVSSVEKYGSGVVKAILT